MNLVGNAIKFTAFGGQIKVTCRIINNDNDLAVKLDELVKIM